MCVSIYSDELGRLIGACELSRDMSASRASLSSLSMLDNDDDSATLLSSTSSYCNSDQQQKQHNDNDYDNHQSHSNVCKLAVCRHHFKNCLALHLLNGI